MVTSFGNSSFRGCISLISVTIPDSVTSIGEFAFSGCRSMKAIDIGIMNSSFSSVDGVLYNKSQTTLIQCPGGYKGHYSIPDTVIDIGDSAFSGCKTLTSVTIGDSVTHIGDSAFNNCSDLASVTIPDSVTSIGGSAFYLCFNHRSSTIGYGGTCIGVWAFGGCGWGSGGARGG
ncbi:MAG: leucine-rich repeat domain-containing protein, partial [Verrucomicrobiota bacterium]|nr:leucine-rich repeat domain-containing protein [Verrucomicrobiota bacterium]